MKAWILLVVLLAATTAGCIGGDDAVDPGAPTGTQPETPPRHERPGDAPPLYKPAEVTNLEKQLKAIELVPADDPEWDSPNLTRRDWGLMSVPLSPEGTFAAYSWQVPRDAIIRADGSDLPMVMLDFALPLGPMGTPAGLPEGTDYALFVMHAHPTNGQLTIAHLIHRVTREIDVQEPGGASLGSPTTHPAPSDPFSAKIIYPTSEGVQPGDTIYFLLAARGSSPSEFGLAFRPLSQQAATLPAGDSPTQDWEDFHNLVGRDRTPFVPHRLATGSGLHIATYVETHVAGSSYVERGGDAVIEAGYAPALYPSLTAGTITVSSSTAWGGWSHTRGSYVSAADSGSWSVDLDVHGQTEAATGAFFNMQEEIGGITVSGFPPPNFFGEAEGNTGSSIEFSLTKNGRTLASERLRFEHIAVGGQLSEIFGLSIVTLVGASGGVGA